MATILVVDDDPLILTAVRCTLESAGHGVIASDGARDILALIKHLRVDGIVLDIVMPQISGTDVLKALRGNDATSHVPVLLMSAKAAPEDRVDGLKLGADDYLTKPFDSDELLFRVQRMLGGSSRAKPSGLVKLTELVQGDHDGRGVPLGRYTLLGLLGEGAMGLVFRGIDPRLRRPVAIKTIHFMRQASPSEQQRMVDDLLEEAVRAAQISHPNVIAVYDVEDAAEAPYIAMEFVDGTTLFRHVMDSGRLDGEQIAPLGLALARALAAAHAHGMVHRDVKPANVLLGRSGEIKVSDFGLASAVSAVAKASGKIWGTAGFLPPETLYGEGYDELGDLFGLGASLYFAVTGERAFPGPTIPEILNATVAHDPTPPSQLNPALSQPLEELVLRLLARDREMRPPSAAAVVDELEAMGAGRTQPWHIRIPDQEPATRSDDVGSCMLSAPLKRPRPPQPLRP